MAAVYKIGSKWRADWTDEKGVRHRLRFKTAEEAKAHVDSIASRIIRSLLNQNERDRDQANKKNGFHSNPTEAKQSTSKDDDEASLNDDKPMSSNDKAILMRSKAELPGKSLCSPAFLRVRHLQKRSFLRAFAETGNITQSAEVAGVHRDTHYDWLKDEAYAEAFKKAQVMVGHRFEEEVCRRAFHGIDKPLVYQGQISKDENGNPVTVKEYSDLLAIFALKGIFPEKYRDNQPGVNFQGPTQVNITIKNESSLPTTAQDFISCSEEKETKD